VLPGNDVKLFDELRAYWLCESVPAIVKNNKPFETIEFSRSFLLTKGVATFMFFASSNTD
jgi:hypothetical protein